MYSNLRKLSFVCLVLTSLIFISCSDDYDAPGQNPIEVADVRLSNDAQLGSFISNSEGRALYFFSRDVEGNSACLGNCLQNWPVFFKADLKVGDGLIAEDFGVITREDGSSQTTYKGWPLYYFTPDVETQESNDGYGGTSTSTVLSIKGDGVGGVWFVAKNDYSVMLAEKEVAGATTKFLVDPSGNTLYTFTPDGQNESNCSGQCLVNWPAYFVNNVSFPSTLNPADFSVFTREDGQDQESFQGRPLYYFIQDQKRGDTNGEGANDVWFVAKSID